MIKILIAATIITLFSEKYILKFKFAFSEGEKTFSPYLENEKQTLQKRFKN